MIHQFILEFADYLNQNGYAVSSEKISRFFVMMGEDIDITNEQEIIPVMQTVFCTSHLQSDMLPEYFHTFLRYHQQILDAKDSEKKMEDLQSARSSVEREIDKVQKSGKQKIQEIKDRKAKTEEEIRKRIEEEERAKMTGALSDTDKKSVTKMEKDIKGLKNSTVSEALIEGKDNQFSNKDLHDAEKDLMEAAKKAFLSGKADQIKTIKKIQGMIHKILDFRKDSEKLIQNRIRRREPEVQKALADLLEEQKRAEADFQNELERQKKTQREIDERLRALINGASMPSLEIKESAKSHRDQFHGHKATQVLNDAPACIDEKFDKLTDSEKKQIQDYLLSNLLKFKTRLTRNIATLERDRIDIQSTIQYACKTGGLPMELHFHQKRPSKTSLLLILDVSGSCKEASSMMLTFMYYLQSIFPRGCKAYAFVDSLYDISEMMYAKDPDAAIDAALNTIPRKGVYSNYARPLHSLWDEHKQEITKDTMVIFMGDARNNRNDPSYDVLKYICRKAKKAYWLNTEEVRRWDTADSLASSYAKYARMYETVTLKDLVWFVNEGIR